MCGICGIVSDNGEIVQRETVERMSSIVHHRGPDDAGFYIDRTPQASVGLGHRRLSIIDLSPAGHQPMTNEDETIWLSYNGEIYNHAEVRRELIALGHRYRSHTDSETIIHAYEEWGDRCVERFRGMFAFAIWDGPKRRLLLARDRLGVKPLYYAQIGRTIVFGSEIKSLLASGQVAPTFAEGALPEYLTFGYLAGDQTMFGSVKKLQPGHVLVWEDGRCAIARYWNVKFQPDESRPAAELQERFVELLEESVRLRLMSDVPLGVFLSGGLDSSAIASVMSRHVSGRLKTFSVGFETGHYSELPVAREVAGLIGADHHEVILTPDAFFSSLPRMIWHEDEPLWGSASVALYHVSELAAKSVTVVLTGEGSDETFAGYDRYWMSALNARIAPAYGRMPEAVRGMIRRGVVDGALPARVRRALSHTVLNHDDTPEHAIFDNWFAVFTPDMQRTIGTAALRQATDACDVYAAHRALWNESGASSLVDQMLYTDIKSNLVELLMKQDQMSMAASIESRVPFLDHHLVEFAGTVPWRHKIRRKSGKYLLKQALKSYLPDGILNRPKKGFPVPVDDWLRAGYLDQVSAVLLDQQAVQRGWFERARVASMIDDYRSGRQSSSRQIWCLLNLELWARIFLDGDQTWLNTPAEAWQSAGTTLAGA